MPPDRSPLTNQRTNPHEGHPWRQFCPHTTLHRLIRPREDVREGAEQLAILQILHVRNDNMEALCPTTSMSAVGTSTCVILPPNKMAHILQNVDDCFKEKGSARLFPGTMQTTFRTTFWAATIHNSRNAANSYHYNICPMCFNFQCQ